MTVRGNFVTKNIKLDDSDKIYLNDLKNYPVLSRKETISLTKEYQRGNLDVKNKIIEGNLRLVANIAFRYKSSVSSLSFLDLIQEGSIGLIRSIETYDESKGSFSNYAGIWIEQAIMRYIKKNSTTITVPEYIVTIRQHYKYLVEDYYNHYGKNPTDKYIIDELHKKGYDIGKSVLKTLKNYENYNTKSINEIVNNDSEDEFVEFIEDQSGNCEKILDNMELIDTFKLIKNLLSNQEYYIIYYRLLSDNSKTQKELSVDFNIKIQRIAQIEQKALQKIKPFILKNSSSYKNKLFSLKKLYGKKFNKLKIKPLSPNDICIFLYLKDKLSILEQNILYLKLIDKYDYELEDIRQLVNVSKHEFNSAYGNLNLIMKRELKDLSKFEEFKKAMIDRFGSKIYDVELLENEKIIDYQKINKTYFNISLKKIEEIFGSVLEKLTEKEKDIIYKYYRKNIFKSISPLTINRKINILLFGYYSEYKKLDITKLFNTFNDNRNLFSQEQVLFLESYIFNLKSEDEFLNIYPNSNLSQYSDLLIEKLEYIYYGIYRLSNSLIDKDRYLLIREKNLHKLNEEKRKLLDLYYGVGIKKMSLDELAIFYGLKKSKIKKLIQNAKEYVINVCSNNNLSTSIDKSLYVDYVLDLRFILSDDLRHILKLYILDDKSYNEISEITGISSLKIMKTIGNLLKRIDNYRYDIVHFDDYTIEGLEKFYSNSKYEFTDYEKKIIKNRFIDGNLNKDVAIAFGITESDVKKIIDNFVKYYYLYQIKDVSLCEKDIVDELEMTDIESVVSKEEKCFLSYFYGIKNSYNIEGLKLGMRQIAKKMDLSQQKIKRSIDYAIRKIKGRKINIRRPDLLYIEKSKLEILLKDPHLPINIKERETICYLFELEGYKKQTMDEIAKLNCERVDIARRRYLNSILNILKYENNELAGKINYEVDILPNLKYFPKNQQLLIIDYYKNNMPYNQMAEKYENITVNQLNSIFDSIRSKIYEIINSPGKHRFDFDFYEKNRFNRDLPFYGNVELADKIFRLYFGIDGMNRKMIPEIVNELNLSNSKTSVLLMIYKYMLAMCKLKDGMVKSKEISNNVIVSHYNKYKDTMVDDVKKSFESYFNRLEKNKRLHVQKTNINNIILYDIISKNNCNLFDVRTADRDQILSILRKFNNKIDEQIKDYLMLLFDISNKDIMTENEINSLYRVLNKLECLLEKDKIKSKK